MGWYYLLLAFSPGFNRKRILQYIFIDTNFAINIQIQIVLENCDESELILHSSDGKFWFGTTNEMKVLSSFSFSKLVLLHENELNQNVQNVWKQYLRTGWIIVWQFFLKNQFNRSKKKTKKRKSVEWWFELKNDGVRMTQKPFINSKMLDIEQLDGSTFIQTHQLSRTHTRAFSFCMFVCVWHEFDSRVACQSTSSYVLSPEEQRKKKWYKLSK